MTKLATPTQNPERRALLISILATAMLSVLGILWGIAISSQMVLFDGVFGLVGIITSALLLRASSLAARKPSRHFPYGQQSATPLVIGIQGFVLLVTLGYAAVEAITTIRLGGSHFSPGVAIPYGCIAAVVSIVLALWMRRAVKHSDLIEAESTAWLIGGLRGAGMVIGFTCMMLLTGSSWDAAVPYIDPAMVLLTCVLFIRPPLRMVRSTIHELLEGAPDAEVQAPVMEAIAAVQRQYNIVEPIIRINKVGSKLYVEVDAFVAPEVTVMQEHEMRTTLERRLRELPYEIWLNLDLLPKQGAPNCIVSQKQTGPT
jgi:cation diffusion facilitator family transporter